MKRMEDGVEGRHGQKRNRDTPHDLELGLADDPPPREGVVLNRGLRFPKGKEKPPPRLRRRNAESRKASSGSGESVFLTAQETDVFAPVRTSKPLIRG